MFIRLCDLPNKHMYYNMLCEELDRLGVLEKHVADISKQYLYEMFYV